MPCPSRIEKTYATRWPMACSAITTTVPDIRLQKPATERGQRGKAEVAALDAAAADGVADDDEGRGEHQERHRGQRLLALALVQQLEARRLQGQKLIAAGQAALRPQSRSPAPAANAPNPTRTTQTPTLRATSRRPHRYRRCQNLSQIAGRSRQRIVKEGLTDARVPWGYSNSRPGNEQWHMREPMGHGGGIGGSGLLGPPAAGSRLALRDAGLPARRSPTCCGRRQPAISPDAPSLPITRRRRGLQRAAGRDPLQGAAPRRARSRASISASSGPR